MAQVTVKYRVDLIKSKRGWGSKVDENKYFNKEIEALAFVNEYNAKNTSETVPDWYMYALAPVMEIVE